MRKIKISNKENIYFLIDKEYYQFFKLHKWYLSRGGYATSNFRGKDLTAQQLLLKYSSNQEIDHINRNKLDNRLCNLRVVSKIENRQNVGISKSNTSGFKGVSFLKKNKVWVANIGKGKNRIHLGSYLTIERAAFAYNYASKLRYGNKCFVNKLPRELVTSYIINADIGKIVRARLNKTGRVNWQKDDFL